VIKTIWRSLRSLTLVAIVYFKIKLTHDVLEASSLPRVEDANLSYYFVIADKIKLNQNIITYTNRENVFTDSCANNLFLNHPVHRISPDRTKCIIENFTGQYRLDELALGLARQRFPLPGRCITATCLHVSESFGVIRITMPRQA